MYAATHRPIAFSSVLRALGRAGSVLLLATWMSYVIVEFFRPGFRVDWQAFYQAVALIVVFIGYALAWRRELAGSVLAMAGVVGYFAVILLTVGVAPGVETLWFAAPAVLLLWAKYLSQSRGPSGA